MQINYFVIALGKQKDPHGNELFMFRTHMQISEYLICSVNKDLERFNFSVPLSLLGRQDKSTELFVSRHTRSPLC